MTYYFLKTVFFLVSFTPIIVFVFSVVALMAYILRKNIFKKLVASFVIFEFAYVSSLSLAQYLVWSDNQATKLFTYSPVMIDDRVPHVLKTFLSFFDFRGGYFSLYVFNHFWLSFVISLFFSAGFYFLLILLKHLRIGDSLEGEEELGFLCTLLSGWPGFVIFVPLVFLLAILISIAKFIFFKISDTTLGWPFLLAFFILSLWKFFGDPIVFFHLSVLKI